jgi:drug/metabolite transporter (DMT)-like permease
MTTSARAGHTQAILLLLLANLFWGLSFPLIKALTLLHAQLLPHAGTWFAAIYTVAPRFLLAVLILLALRPRDAWRATPREWHQGVLLGLFAAAGMLFQNDGLQFTHASTSAFLTQFYAIMIPVWIAVRSRHNPGARVWLCCGLVLAGVAVLGGFNPLAWHRDGGGLAFGRGEWETLLSSVFFMGQILTLERRDFAGNRPEKITFVMFATEAAIFAVLAGTTAPDAAALLAPWRSLPWLGFTLALTVFCTLGAFSLMNAWQPKITATEAGLIYCIEPIFGSAMALFLPAWLSAWAAIDYANERATWALLAGGGLITLANLILQFKPPARG